VDKIKNEQEREKNRRFQQGRRRRRRRRRGGSAAAPTDARSHSPSHRRAGGASAGLRAAPFFEASTQAWNLRWRFGPEDNNFVQVFQGGNNSNSNQI
jgi:hypothetical protein